MHINLIFVLLFLYVYIFDTSLKMYFSSGCSDGLRSCFKSHQTGHPSFLSLSSVAHTDVVAVLCSPVCLTAVCSSRHRKAGRARAAGHRGLCRCCSIWTSARACYSRYTHTSEESVSAERSLEWMLCVCVCGLTPALSRWPAGAAVFWLC